MGGFETCMSATGVVVMVLCGVAVFSVWVDQCSLGHGDSLHVQVNSVHLTSAPTDNVLFGWESLFGKPADEISLKIKSSMCANTHEAIEFKEGDIVNYGSSLTINTFYRQGFSFWLVEDDAWFEGADDYSQVITVSSNQMDRMRYAFNSGAADYIDLDYAVVVEGQNIFQEHEWFGFIADNLCVSALDFVFGPWTSKALGRAVLFNSGDMARLYNSVKNSYKAGTLTKRGLFKSVMAYQLRTGAKKAVINPALANGREIIAEWALDQTHLDEEINEAVTALKEEGIYQVAGQEGLDIYHAVQQEIETWAGYLETLTDSLEFCLGEVLPPSRDALYHVSLTVTP